MLLLALSASLTESARAGVYKCFENGQWVYSDRMCAADSTPLRTDPNMNRARSAERNEGVYVEGARHERYGGKRKDKDETVVIDSGDAAAKVRCEALKRWRAEAARNGSYRGKTSDELEDLDFSLCYGRVNKAQ